MLQYVDGFSCSINPDTGALVIHFKQNEPIVNETNGEIIVKTNDVTSIIMDKHCVASLISFLNETYNIQTDTTI